MPGLHNIRVNINHLMDLVRDDKQEHCGVMLGRVIGQRRFIEEIVRVHNSHPDPQNHYQITKEDLLDTIGVDEVPRIVGYAHTHCSFHSPLPSKHDIRATMPGLIGVVVQIPGSIIFFNHKGVIGSLAEALRRS